MRGWYLLILWLFFIGCGRYFAGPIRPEDQQGMSITVYDDGSVTYAHERLEISLRPVSDKELNRQFVAQSQGGAESTNPYTYGDWKPMGDTWTPERFTVFLLKVKNYAYPKVSLDPENVEVVSENGRRYQPLTRKTLVEYYRALALSYSGNTYARFSEREGILNTTLFNSSMIFSGQEQEGYVVFSRLHDDVKQFSVHLRKIALRFDYRNVPKEAIDLTFRFHRDISRGYHPPKLVGEK